jgi:hypothetical protein
MQQSREFGAGTLRVIFLPRKSYENNEKMGKNQGGIPVIGKGGKKQHLQKTDQQREGEGASSALIFHQKRAKLGFFCTRKTPTNRIQRNKAEKIAHKRHGKKSFTRV